LGGWTEFHGQKPFLLNNGISGGLFEFQMDKFQRFALFPRDRGRPPAVAVADLTHAFAKRSLDGGTTAKDRLEKIEDKSRVFFPHLPVFEGPGGLKDDFAELTNALNAHAFNHVVRIWSGVRPANPQGERRPDQPREQIQWGFHFFPSCMIFTRACLARVKSGFMRKQS
jgi:hypothetical protein